MTDEKMTLKQAIAQLENPHQHELVLNHGELTEWLKELQVRRDADLVKLLRATEIDDEETDASKEPKDFNFQVLEHIYKYQTAKHWVDEAITKALDKLTDRENYVVNQRLRCHRTLQSLAEELELCRERIRQIEAKAYRKMSNCMSNKPEIPRYCPEVKIWYVPCDKTIPIEDMGFSARVYNALNRSNIHTLGDLLNACADLRVCRIRNIGNGSLEEIKRVLIACGVDESYIQLVYKS